VWHNSLIALHTISGLAALVAGCVALRRGDLFRTYEWSLAGTILFVALAVGVDWAELDTPARALFAALGALGAFMVWRAEQARRLRPVGSDGPSARYVDHVGFTLVALFDAFVVIAVLDLGGPGWLVAAVGVIVAIVGHFVLVAVRDRLVPAAQAQRRQRRRGASGPPR